MSEKLDIVFDTNFIISYFPKLHIINQKLSTNHNVWITDVSILEILSKRYLEIKTEYEKIEEFKIKHSSVIQIEIISDFEDKFKIEKERKRQEIINLFGDNIIQFSRTIDMFQKIISRTYRKNPPFINSEGASDKGFKDTMLWLSLLEHFKNSGDNNVVFVTNDNGFIKSHDSLCKEFNLYTSKTIDILNDKKFNSSFEIMEKSKISIADPVQPLDLPRLKDKIQNYVSALCYGEYYENSWGNLEFSKTFSMANMMTVDDMKIIFENLPKIIEDNIFENDLEVDQLITVNNPIQNYCPIPIQIVKNNSELYNEIRDNYPIYLEQFLKTAAKIFNKNYIEIYNYSYLTDDGIPF